jgi:hypothetical protein
MARDFTIVFEKLIEEESKQGSSESILTLDLVQEVDEIAELRRMIAATMEPEPASFTTT